MIPAQPNPNVARPLIPKPEITHTRGDCRGKGVSGLIGPDVSGPGLSR
ncbi:hypothetical protein I551_7208 [Mycobacterium ulcerans str. Harvey]|uniref:Uncharacterized protein n=1 Tax=Mycobacterium ulcerans str. Harvey TaxID=1299332 RepID=A0ABN0QNX1_MYCUL|nr:hypothetical protein I551_7208 [Mycobacterium ulcerans str. Harvey]